MHLIKRIVKKILVSLFRALPINKNKILFCSFTGQGYSGNPKYICEELLSRKDKNAKSLKIVWLLADTNVELPRRICAVKFKSIRAYFEYATSKVLIQDIRNAHLCKKRKGQIYLQTWHAGHPTKHTEGLAEKQLSAQYIKEAKYDGSITDGIIVDGELQEELMKKYYWLGPQTEFLRYGVPYNDFLIRNKDNEKLRNEIRKKLGFKRDIILVLYAPTFRDDNSEAYYLSNYEALLHVVEKRFRKKACILVRFHPNVANIISLTDGKHIKNVTTYPDPQELALACDIVISDYSSIVFDFDALDKTVFLLTKDFSTYSKTRGLLDDYYDLPFPRANTEGELFMNIEKFDANLYNKKAAEYRKKYKNYNDGKSAKNTLDWILKKMSRL